MTAPLLKTISTSVRPARVAILLDSTDKEWMANACRVIEFYSTVWGGFHNIIIPTDGDKIEDQFWNVLDVYDPDFLGYYYRSWADIKINDPELYEKNLNGYVERLRSQHPSADIDNVRKSFDRQLALEQITESPSIKLQDELKKRIAPFHFEEHSIEIGIGINDQARYPLAPLLKVLPNCDHSFYLAGYESYDKGVYDLWQASITGSATDEFKAELAKFEIVSHRIDQTPYESMYLLVNNGVNRHNTRSEFSTPFDLTKAKLGLYRSVKAHDFRGPVIVIVGDTISDFCLYYSLSRFRPQVVWLPLEWLKSHTNPKAEEGSLFDLYSMILQSSDHKRDTNPKYIFTSQSLNGSQIEKVIQELTASYSFTINPLDGNYQIQFSLDKILKHPLRLYEEDNVDRQSSIMIREGAFIDVFNTPKPKKFTNLDPYEHRWITDINVIGSKLPRHYALGNWIVRHPTILSNTARIGRTGISFHCPHSMYFGGDIDTSTVRPTIFIPTAIQLFEKVFDSAKYQVRMSDKGFYAQDSISKFGDLSTISILLRDDKFRSVLVKYLDHSKPKSGVHDDGALLNDGRRYLNLPTISKLIGKEVESQRIIETLVQRQILYRGYAFKCKFCRGADWFSIEETSQVFKCKRCGRSQFITKENYWYSEYEPGWYYKLDEIVYLFLLHNGDVPILALDYLRGQSEEGFLYTTDLEVFENGSENPLMEMDIVGVCDGLITLGEAKKANVLANTKAEENRSIEKYYRIATNVGADQLVFATLSDAWSQRTQEAIKRIIDEKKFKTKLLTKTELLSDPRFKK